MVREKEKKSKRRNEKELRHFENVQKNKRIIELTKRYQKNYGILNKDLKVGLGRREKKLEKAKYIIRF